MYIQNLKNRIKGNGKEIPKDDDNESNENDV